MTLVITGQGLQRGPVGPDSAPTRFAPRALRRVSALCRLTLPAVETAWVQAALSASPAVGLVVGTGLADLGETAAFLTGLAQRGPRFASPQHFQRSVHGATAGELAILYGLVGYNLTVSQSRAHAALEAAGLAVMSGRCDRCLCVVADRVTPELEVALDALGCEPAVDRAIALVVEEARAAEDRGVAPLASVGWPWSSTEPSLEILRLYGDSGPVTGPEQRTRTTPWTEDA